jgi:hypothetical protein
MMPSSSGLQDEHRTVPFVGLLRGQGRPLSARSAQSDLQLLLLLLPAGVLRLGPFVEGGALGFDGARSLVVLPFCLGEGCFRLGGCLLAPPVLLRPDGVFLPALVFALPLLSVERECSSYRRSCGGVVFSASHGTSLVRPSPHEEKAVWANEHVP